MRILNLYAGIGGNRKLWPITDNDEVVAVEIIPEIAEIYKRFYPNDKIIVDDAHKYLLEHYQEFDFIWSSPPCPSHSRNNNYLNAQGVIRYPDMSLYQEIIFLKHFFKGIWVVENVKPYYESLIKAQQAGRHYFWTNFIISNWKQQETFNISYASHKKLSSFHNFNIEVFKNVDKTKVLRNCVNPYLALHIWNCAFKTKQILMNEVKE